MKPKVKNNRSLFQKTNAVARQRNASWDRGSIDQSTISLRLIVAHCLPDSQSDIPD